MKTSVFAILVFFVFATSAQLYFPPLTGNTWETMNPSELNWCQSKIDSLYTYLEEQDTKAFIVLKDGKIVLEQYFNGHSQNATWYWASAGKTITSFLVGMAQQEELLDIENPTSDYLGTGWTSCTPEQEEAITVWHQLTMTSGLDDGVPNLGCTTPDCLQYLAAPGSRWSYHNAPYTLLDQVIANATDMTLNQYTTQKLKNPTGMTGSYIAVEENTVFFSNARSMARFGLLMLNNGNWNGDQVMTDTEYFNAMINTSQELNLAYGYLWWLNGKASYMVPSVQLAIPGSFLPNAPEDMYTAQGKNGQFLNVVPSQNLVLIRMGEEPSGSLVPFLMNDKIWEYMNDLDCANLGVSDFNLENSVDVFPNPSQDKVTLKTNFVGGDYQILDAMGRVLTQGIISSQNTQISMSSFSAGSYFVRINHAGQHTTKLVILK
jgi:CubicO group peptidase (beta-lactamase class C family)